MNEALRFNGIERLYGHEQFDRLKNLSVCVVGIGGVGSWVCEALARTGINNITMIDMDEICESNINRQIHADTSTIGNLKTEEMLKRITNINPKCNVSIIDDFLELENINILINHNYDLVIDAIDNARVKAGLINFCYRKKVSIVSVGGAGGQIDPTKIKIDDLSKIYNDPLMSKVRNLLRTKYGFPRDKKFKIKGVFSEEQLRYPDTELKTYSFKKPGNTTKLDCSAGFGSCSIVTASFAFFAVHAGLKLKKIT